MPREKVSERAMGTEKSRTVELAEFCTSLNFRDLPVEVVSMAKRLLLDALGCGLAGSTTELGRAALRANSSLATATGRAHVIARDQPTAAEVAALVNAFYINALDFDEDSCFGHPGASVASASLALTEEYKRDGAHLIAGIVAGYEASERIAASIWPSIDRESDVWGIGVHQTLGAAASAFNMAQLSVRDAVEVLGLAGVMASLPSAWQWNWGDRPLSWHKDSVAWAAFAGVQSLRLKQAGFQGPRRVLEGSRSLWRMSGSDQHDPDQLTAGLGTEWRILDSNIKPYSCCRWIHSILDATLEATAGKSLVARDVTRIDVRGVDLIVEYDFLDATPRNIVDAEFSVNYAVAMVLLGIPPGPEWYLENQLRNPEVIGLASRVHYEVDDEATRSYLANRSCMPARVLVTLASGNLLEGGAYFPRGGPERPLTKEFVESKFLRLSTSALGREASAALLDMVSRTESLEDVSSLFTFGLEAQGEGAVQS
jgi:2-methylcitrate dehydratase PrpD